MYTRCLSPFKNQKYWLFGGLYKWFYGMQICQLRDANNTISNLLNNRIDDNRLQKLKDSIDLITKNVDISEELRTSIQNKLEDDLQLNKVYFEKEYSTDKVQFHFNFN